MIKHFVLAASLTASLATAANANNVAAVLVADDYECKSDHMVFETNSGYVTTEWFGGSMSEDNIYFADFHSYGFTDVYDKAGNEAGRVYVDDFWLSNSGASEYCYSS